MKSLALFVGAALALIAGKWFAMHDVPFWDEAFYVRAARAVHATHFSLHVYVSGTVVRPPLVAFYLALVQQVSGSLAALRIAMCVLAAGLVPCVPRLVAALGGTLRARILAPLLLLAAPLYVAQSSLVLSDMAVTVAIAWAWLALLERRTVTFTLCACAAVLCKESGYVVALVAAAVLWRRDRRPFAAIAPLLLLGAWVVARKLCAGTATPGIDRHSIGYNHLDAALIHDLWEGGRFLLLPWALVALRRREPERVWTAVLVIAFPLLFPAPLPRYMLPTLPLLCALAAVGLDTQPAPRAWAYAAVALVFGATTLRTPSWHTNGGHHLDCNLRYRRLLALQVEATRRLAAEHPRAVLSTFPIIDLLGAAPADGVLAAPLSVVNAERSAPCGPDWLVSSSTETPAAPSGVVAPWLRLTDEDFFVQLSRVSCDGR